eukprot:TRINITY_DN12533_c0_g1_i1.p1 TRINITY_DN12533_c0_g1~~TRINITY_DN12533_c0_g1_i1.p1  ORF type:complete len:368 (+),score=50.58 TRINITY_DN12533_c0_g1_i1:70-1173(+)
MTQNVSRWLASKRFPNCSDMELWKAEDDITELRNVLQWNGKRGTQLHHENHEIEKLGRCKVIDMVRKTTECFQHLCNSRYGSRTQALALQMLDVLTGTIHITQSDLNFYVIACVMISVKTEESIMPHIDCIAQFFRRQSSSVILDYEMAALQALGNSMHFITTWDQLVYWCDALQKLPNVTLQELLLLLEKDDSPDDDCRSLPFLVYLKHTNTNSNNYSYNLLTAAEKYVPPPEYYCENSIIDKLPFDRSEILKESNLNKHAPRAYDFCLVHNGLFGGFPSAIVALCCLVASMYDSESEELLRAIQKDSDLYKISEITSSFIACLLKVLGSHPRPQVSRQASQATANRYRHQEFDAEDAAYHLAAVA